MALKMLKSSVKMASSKSVRMHQPITTALSSKRTRGAAWMAIRDKVFKRDCGICVECTRHGRITVATQVDHVKPLAMGGTDDLDNLESICHQCHSVKTAAENAAIRVGAGQSLGV